MLLEALDKYVAGFSVDDFYYLSRAALVKDEKFFDRYDRVFGQFFKGIQDMTEGMFGADMSVSLVNEGPITFWFES